MFVGCCRHQSGGRDTAGAAAGGGGGCRVGRRSVRRLHSASAKASRRLKHGVRHTSQSGRADGTDEGNLVQVKLDFLFNLISSPHYIFNENRQNQTETGN